MPTAATSLTSLPFPVLCHIASFVAGRTYTSSSFSSLSGPTAIPTYASHDALLPLALSSPLLADAVADVLRHVPPFNEHFKPQADSDEDHNNTNDNADAVRLSLSPTFPDWAIALRRSLSHVEFSANRYTRSATDKCFDMYYVDISKCQSLPSCAHSNDRSENTLNSVVADEIEKTQEDREEIKQRTVLLDSVLRLTTLCEQHQLPRLRDLDFSSVSYFDQFHHLRFMRKSRVSYIYKKCTFSHAIASLINHAAVSLTSLSLPAIVGLSICLQAHSFMFPNGLKRIRLRAPRAVGSDEIFANLLCTVITKCESPHLSLHDLVLENVDARILYSLHEHKSLRDLFENAKNLHKLTVTLRKSFRVENHNKVTEALSMFKHVRTLALTAQPCGPFSRSLCQPNTNCDVLDVNDKHQRTFVENKRRIMPRLTALEYTPRFQNVLRGKDDQDDQENNDEGDTTPAILDALNTAINFRFLDNTIKACAPILTKFSFPRCITHNDRCGVGDVCLKDQSLAVDYEEYIEDALFRNRNPFNVGCLLKHCSQLRELNITISADCMMSDTASLLRKNCVTLTHVSIEIVPSVVVEMESSIVTSTIEPSSDGVRAAGNHGDDHERHGHHSCSVEYWKKCWQFNPTKDWNNLATAIAELSHLKCLIIDDGSASFCPTTKTQLRSHPLSNVDNDEANEGVRRDDAHSSSTTPSLQPTGRPTPRSCFELPLSISEKQELLEGLRIIIHGVADKVSILRVTVALDLQPLLFEISNTYACVLEAMLNVGNRCTIGELSVALFSQNDGTFWHTRKRFHNRARMCLRERSDKVEKLMKMVWGTCESLAILRLGCEGGFACT